MKLYTEKLLTGALYRSFLPLMARRGHYTINYLIDLPFLPSLIFISSIYPETYLHYIYIY